MRAFLALFFRERIGVPRVLVAAIAAVFLLSNQTHAAQPAVDKVRVQTHQGFTRVILETNAPIEPNLFTLGPPFRLVIDLPQLQWRIPLPAGPVDSPLVRRYSFGLFEPGVSRLVLSLSGPTRLIRRSLKKTGDSYAYTIDLDNSPSSPTYRLSSESAAPFALERKVVESTEGDLPTASTIDPAKKSSFADRTFDPAAAEYENLADVLGDALARAKADEPVEEPFETASLDPELTPDLAPERDPTPETEPEPEIVKEIEKIERQDPSRPPLRIVLDPGHGGRDPGTGSESGVSEKDINLAFAMVLAELLRADPNYEVFLTREIDKRVKLPNRVQFARRKSADLFISIHADWSDNENAEGATAYTLSEEASVQALDSIATKKNEVGRVAGVDLAAEREDVARLLVDLARRDTQARSVNFAELVIAELSKATPVLRRPLRKDSFHVLKAPDMPSVLLELGFISNLTDRERLQSTVWRLTTAEAVKRAIDEFRRANSARGFDNP